MGYLMLGYMNERGPVRASAVVEAFNLDKGAVSRHVQALVEFGLATKERDPDDGRAWVVSLTEEGRPRMHELATVRRAQLGRRLEDWSDDELELLRRHPRALQRQPRRRRRSPQVQSHGCAGQRSQTAVLRGQLALDRTARDDDLAGRQWDGRVPAVQHHRDVAAPEGEYVAAESRRSGRPPLRRRRAPSDERPAPSGRTPASSRAVPSGPPRSARLHSGGCGSHGCVVPGPKSKGGSVPPHGIGTRQPSRPISPVRNHDGSCRSAAGTSACSRPSSSPW